MSPFRSFADELVKISSAGLPPELRAAAHLSAPAKDWKKFEKDLKNPKVRAAIQSTASSPEAKGTVDLKLKRYIKNYGDYLASKDVVGEVPSRTDPKKTYEIRRLPSGRLACGCGDWQYVRSVGSSDCAHVKALKEKS